MKALSFNSIRNTALAGFAALALIAGSVNQAQAGQGETLPATASGGDVGFYTGVGMFVAWTAGMAYIVYRDIANGGLNRKFAEVVPGAGYKPVDLARTAELTHSFNVAMGYADDAQTVKYLASVAR